MECGGKMIEFDDIELLQLQLCLQMTKSKMSMGGDVRRHASITKKVKEEIRQRGMV